MPRKHCQGPWSTVPIPTQWELSILKTLPTCTGLRLHPKGKVHQYLKQTQVLKVLQLWLPIKPLAVVKPADKTTIGSVPPVAYRKISKAIIRPGRAVQSFAYFSVYKLLIARWHQTWNVMASTLHRRWLTVPHSGSGRVCDYRAFQWVC